MLFRRTTTTHSTAKIAAAAIASDLLLDQLIVSVAICANKAAYFMAYSV